MPTDATLSTVITQVLSHTPVWVWIILAAITSIGLRQLAESTVSATRLTLVPVILGAYSLAGATQAFGLSLPVIAGWMAGMGLVVAVGLAMPRQVKAQSLGGGQYLVAGSVLPLLTMWGVFAVRYVSNVTLVLHPQWAHGSVFSLAMPFVYGALSGFFAARALRILLGSTPAPALSLA